MFHWINFTLTHLPVSVMWFIHWFDIAIATLQHGNMLARQCRSHHTIWWIAAWYIQHILMYIDLCFLLLGYWFNIIILTLHLAIFGHDLSSISFVVVLITKISYFLKFKSRIYFDYKSNYCIGTHLNNQKNKQHYSQLQNSGLPQHSCIFAPRKQVYANHRQDCASVAVHTLSI